MKEVLHEKINYVEFPTRDILSTKAFFSAAFGWEFTDYGPEYSAFSAVSAGLEGGFYTADLTASTHSGSALIVLYSQNLEETQKKVMASGGSVVKEIFSFLGAGGFILPIHVEMSLLYGLINRNKKAREFKLPGFFAQGC